jgi:tripartite-type tricarboxylate transporter receptor subunit TctC
MLKKAGLSRRTFLMGSATALLPVATAYGQGSSLPRTINIHVGFPAGGPADTTARLIAEKLRDSTGSAVVVLNRPGAGGTMQRQRSRKWSRMAATCCWFRAGTPARLRSIRT